MALVRWDPFADLRTLHSQVDDMFNQMFAGQSSQFAPATDVYTEGNKLVVEAHLPNFTEDEVNVDVHQGVLDIRAEHHKKRGGQGRTQIPCPRKHQQLLPAHCLARTRKRRCDYCAI